MDKLEYIPGDLCMVKGKVESVCEVDRDNDFSITTDQHPFIRLSEVKPIPLTPEILEKNGWDKDNSKFDEYYDNPEYENRYFNWTYNLTLDLDECSVYKGTSGILYCLLSKIKYVHQLQHLLFGLGLNSEMEV